MVDARFTRPPGAPQPRAPGDADRLACAPVPAGQDVRVRPLGPPRSPGGWDDRRERDERGERVGRPARRRRGGRRRRVSPGSTCCSACAGWALSATVLEAGDDVGGTWYWNRYPGARCDIPTTDYTYSWDPELETDWTWSEKYATQPEILRYLQHVADRYDLRRDIRFSTGVKAAAWDDAASTWTITTERGDTHPLPLVRDGHRLPVGAQGGRHRGHRPLPGRGLLHEPLAPRGRRPHRQARRRDRHRLVGHPVDPDHGPAGVRDGRVPAHAELLDPGPQRRPAGRAPGPDRRRPRGLPRRPASGRVAACRSSTRSTRRRRCPTTSSCAGSRPATQSGELFGILGVFADQATNKAANDVVTDFLRDKIRSIVEGPRDGRDAVPEGPPLRHQAAVPRHRLLRDVQPARTSGSSTCARRRSPRSPRPASRPPTRRSSSTSSCYATGFDAMTGAIVGVDITGKDGATLKDEVGPRAGDVPRPDDRRASRTCS